MPFSVSADREPTGLFTGYYEPELRGAPRGCRREIIEPDPPEDLTAFAASLDQNAESDDGLGIHFAERAVIECRG